ncbi:4'-phosphopantetheinyl transferase family protein [Longirhabdus pacifica]|uniref:4'-phosphopantetheinyl transferase family protein n=1 Tax=Longirhabdus pacifica TaxID=2305227 RepID=UPI0013E8CB52|nr:4'-phosphopantetheinyl transferase superfamily protein [Longirhabdus pacifica]
MQCYGVNISAIEEVKIEELSGFISKERREKLKKFYHREDAVRSLIAELLLRHILVKDRQCQWESISFEKNEFGKPQLKDGADIHFNLSHAGDWVVCGIAEHPIGIDVEKKKDIDVLALSQRFFAKEESELLLNISDKQQQLEMFYTIWTLKESFIKHVGKGLSIALDSFYFELKDAIRFHSVTYEDTYQFHSFSVESDYIFSICSKSSSPKKQPVLHTLSMEQFLSSCLPHAVFIK